MKLKSQHTGGGARLRAPVFADLQDLANRLGSISALARKLLVQIMELPCNGRGEQRKPDVAYLPELYESCGLGVEAMYPLLNELREAGFIEVEDQYPFEDVKIPSTPETNMLALISSLCEAGKIPIREVIVDLRFDLLQ